MRKTWSWVYFRRYIENSMWIRFLFSKGEDWESCKTYMVLVRRLTHMDEKLYHHKTEDHLGVVSWQDLYLGEEGQPQHFLVRATSESSSFDYFVLKVSNS